MKLKIYTITIAAPYRLSIVARPRGNDWLCDEVSALSREGIDTLVSMLTDGEANELGLQHESAECSAAGIKFVNVAMPDRSVPSDRNAFLAVLSSWLTRSGEVATLLYIAAPASVGLRYLPRLF